MTYGFDETLEPHLLEDMICSMHEKQGVSVIRSSYLESEPRLWEMRNAVVGWMVELSQHFDYKDHTLMMSVNLFDRYLSVSKLPTGKLQLLACVATFLAM
jgi:hypothetical protein